MSKRRASSLDRRSFVKLAGGMLGAGMLAGCQQLGGAPPTAAPTATPAATPTATPIPVPNPVRFGHPSPAQPVYNFAIYPTAQQLMKEREGVDFEKKVFRGFTPIAAGFIKEEIEIAYMTLLSLILARSEGLPILAPLGFVKEFSFVMIVKPDITSWDQLAGKTVAVHSPSAMTTVVGRTMVREELGDVEAASYEYILGTPNRLAAMQAGEVDATVVFISGALQAEKDGYAKIFASPWEYDSLSNQTASTFAVLSTTLEDKEEVVGKIVGVLKEAYQRVYEADPAEITEAAIATGIYPEFDADVWQQAFEQAREIDMWPEDGAVTEERLNKAQSVLIDAGLVEEDQLLTLDDFFDDRFL